jgi:hypothetical protein
MKSSISTNSRASRGSSIGNCSMRLTISVSNSLSSGVESRLFAVEGRILALFQLWIIVFAVTISHARAAKLIASYIVIAEGIGFSSVIAS